jgi:hypothetical protein
MPFAGCSSSLLSIGGDGAPKRATRGQPSPCRPTDAPLGPERRPPAPRLSRISEPRWCPPGGCGSPSRSFQARLVDRFPRGRHLDYRRPPRHDHGRHQPHSHCEYRSDLGALHIRQGLGLQEPRHPHSHLHRGRHVGGQRTNGPGPRTPSGLSESTAVCSPWESWYSRSQAFSSAPSPLPELAGPEPVGHRRCSFSSRPAWRRARFSMLERATQPTPRIVAGLKTGEWWRRR